MAAAKSPQERMADELAQQHAAGHYVSDSSRECPTPECEKRATFVSPRNIPMAGPVATTDDYHYTPEGLFVHRDEEDE